MPGYGSLRELRSIILKFKIKSEGATNGAPDEINNADMIDIFSAE